MGLWSVVAVGQGFLRPEGTSSVELHDVVPACDSHAAHPKAMDPATRHWSEIAQGNPTSAAEAVIHAKAMSEVDRLTGKEIDVVDISWT